MYPRLFSPFRLGPLEAANRVMFAAHFTMFTEPSRRWGEPGFYGARLARYLGERAAGGAGVIVAGQAQVHPTTAYQMPNNAIAWDEAAVPGFRLVTDAIHAGGALAFLQLAHNGGVNHGAWSRLPVWAASDVANSPFEGPAPMSRAEIAEVVEHFSRSAKNAAAGGFDGIEVHGAHGYLLHDFLSPRTNRRTDDYGGSLENRLRFPIEVLRAVRDAVGPARAVGIRLVGDEERGPAGGLTPDDAAEIAVRLEDAGLVDFVHVSIGLSGTGMVRPCYTPHLLGVYAARRVKQAVRAVPVIAVHRILTPEEAEGLLARGDADGVAVVRAMIADPEWARKAASGRAAEIRACVGCNQGCYGNLTRSLPVTCVTNPAVGREELLGLGTLVPAAVQRRVVVVGGGPAGLEAAWVAAARGHDVVLLERAGELGGKIRLAAALPGRAELGALAAWRAAECRRRGVDIRLGVDATADDVLALAPDAVVVATGGHASKHGTSKAHPTPIPGVEQDFVIDHEAAMTTPDALGRRVVVLDAVGHVEGFGLGELLATRDIETTVVTPLPSPLNLDAETIAYGLPRAVRAGVRWRPSTMLAAVGDHAVTLVDVLSGRRETLAGVDTVVIRMHGVPDTALAEALAGRGALVLRAGDAVAMRPVDRAIYDGHLAGRRI
jgi:2,4-dienoyl-CoA reductase-like NADH-dependent reductase (Old Yellow Enzyme family)